MSSPSSPLPPSCSSPSIHLQSSTNNNQQIPTPYRDSLQETGDTLDISPLVIIDSIDTMSTYPSLPPSFLHPHHSMPAYHGNSHYMPQPPFAHSHSGSNTDRTSRSSSSLEPVTPELSNNIHINIGDEMNGNAKDRRISNASTGSNEESIECKWADCIESFSSPDKLYDHLCNSHVGRKSTGNLNLTCGWEGCGVKCVKRDHITSHLRGKSSLYRFDNLG